MFSRDDGIRTRHDTTIASLTYSRRILGATDLGGSNSWWHSAIASEAPSQSGTSVEVGLRQQFDGLPRFLRRNGTIEGFAFLDPGMSGSREESAAPLPGLEVVLDGVRKLQTDATGAYAFRDVTPGIHRIAAQLPAGPRAFFSTPSHAETSAPARIDFGVVWAGARIDGAVLSDEGGGVGGIVVSAVMNGGAATARSPHPWLRRRR